MFKEKISVLIDRCKNNQKALDTINKTLDMLNDYTHVLSTGDNPKKITYKECVTSMKSINKLCESTNVPKVFPRLEEISEQEVKKEYIINFVYDYIKKRK